MLRLFFPCLFFLAFFNNACTGSYDSGTRHPSQHTHEYGEEHHHDETIPNNSRLQDKYQNTDFRSVEGANRWIWQKPNVVIDLLGPLEGKVVADIGAGPYGYFAFRIVHQAKAAKVIAIDIDPEAIQFMEDTKMLLAKDIQDRLEARLVKSDDPNLQPGEADIVLIVNTVAYIKDRVDYFSKLLKGMAKGGKILIVDFKKRNTPVGPPDSERIALGQIESELKAAGFQSIIVDDRSLEYQYIVTARVNY